jgi:hypothetical protein
MSPVPDTAIDDDAARLADELADDTLDGVAGGTREPITPY